MATTKNEVLFTPRGRLSFPFLFKVREPKKPTDKKKFSMTLIFDAEAQKDPRFAALREAVKNLALEKFGINVKGPDGVVKRSLPPSIKNPFRKGDEKIREDGTPMDGYGPGTVFISATALEDKPPKLVGGDNKPIAEKDLYAGCYARASVTIFDYENSGNRGVSFGLRGVQKMADGEKFGASTPEFEAVDGYTSAPAGDFGSAPAAGAGVGTSPDDEELPF